MNKSSVELGVGIFVLIGLICVGYLTIQLGKMKLMGDDHYFLNARFLSVSGLKAGAQVEIAGVSNTKKYCPDRRCDCLGEDCRTYRG